MPTVRTARLDDAQAIARIRVAGWQTAYRGIVADEVLDAMDITVRPRLRKQLTSPMPGQAMLVYESDGEIRGFVNCGPYRIGQDSSRIDAGQGAEVYAIYVDPRVWREGCGAALMHGAERFLADASFTRCRLWTLEANQRARRFYAARDYAWDGARLDYVGSDGTPVPEVRYTKTLNQHCEPRR
ncbi:MAG TPA: GNAT family N-acetyltransferase [Candidatus Stackebrandtia faecavium]|nr:GNAT family N-acetyltransferase [Candidatus Stackebrandtia faecavium]